MGVRAENIKGLLKDTRSRTILVITFVALLIAVVIGYFVFRKEVAGPGATADISQSPGIASVPTGAQASPEYARLVQQANIQRAKQAHQTGGSAIPTIIKSVKPGDAQEVAGAKGQPWQTGLGFKQFRVRYHEDIARIEVCGEDFDRILESSDEINQEFKDIGFKYITLDIQGYRMGSLNEVLDL